MTTSGEQNDVIIPGVVPSNMQQEVVVVEQDRTDIQGDEASILMATGNQVEIVPPVAVCSNVQ